MKRFEAEKFMTENIKAVIFKVKSKVIVLVKSAKAESFKVKLVKTAPFEDT